MPADLKPVYLLTGGDRPKIDRALARLRGRFAADAVEHLSATEVDGAGAVDACNALGLFGGDGRLVLVTEAERWKAADAKQIGAYASSPAPDTVLALVAADLKKDAPLAKAIAKQGEVLVYDVGKRDLPKWLAEQFALRGATTELDACRRVLDLVGDDLYELASEADRLATWAGEGGQITEADVERLVPPRAETEIFALTDAWGARDLPRVLGAAESLLEQSSDASRELTRIAGMLAAHAARLRRCQEYEAEGVPSREAAARMKRHPFYVEKLYGQAGNFSPEELRRAVVRLARLDHALKGGSRVAGELELTRALVEITRGHEAAAASR